MTKKTTDAEALASIALIEALKMRIEMIEREKKYLLLQIARLEEMGMLPPEEAEAAREKVTH